MAAPAFLRAAKSDHWSRKSAASVWGQVLEDLAGQRVIALELGLTLIDGCGALIDQLAAFFGQAEQGASVLILRLQGSQSISMIAHHFLLELCVGAVVLGSAHLKGFAEAAQSFGIDRINDDKVVGHQGINDGAARSFNAQDDLSYGKALSQLSHPPMNGFRVLLDHVVFGLALARTKPKVVLLIGPIQADRGDDVIWSGGGVHKMSGCF